MLVLRVRGIIISVEHKRPQQCSIELAGTFECQTTRKYIPDIAHRHATVDPRVSLDSCGSDLLFGRVVCVRFGSMQHGVRERLLQLL